MYQRLQQKLKKIQSFVRNELDGLATTSALDQEAKLGSRAEPALSAGQLAQSRQALVQALGEARQIWGQLQAQPQSHPRWQSLCTEIHKQLRLAEMDVQFWVTARQADTALRRGEQLRDRLSTLIDYCDAGIKLNQQNADEPTDDVIP
ncbi:MAG: heterocyst frequency control protein PatD [Cyanothece sp. SIO2G6]|nr:heterocyst frequency control protein PatD [Cyanothece sp. SIO2G6]